MHSDQHEIADLKRGYTDLGLAQAKAEVEQIAARYA